MALTTLYDADGNPVQVDLQDDDQDETTEPKQKTNSEWAQERRETKQKRQEREENEILQRKIAFLKAGIDPDSTEGMTPYFVGGYKGENTPDAILSAAQAAGLVLSTQQTQQQTQQADQNKQELSASQRISGASVDAVATPSVEDMQRQSLAEAYAKGGMDGLEAAMQSAGVPRQVN